VITFLTEMKRRADVCAPQKYAPELTFPCFHAIFYFFSQFLSSFSTPHSSPQVLGTGCSLYYVNKSQYVIVEEEDDIEEEAEFCNFSEKPLHHLNLM